MNINLKQDRIDELFARAIELPSDKRDAFLSSSCDGDGDIAAEVEKLLSAHERLEQAPDFLASMPKGTYTVAYEEDSDSNRPTITLEDSAIRLAFTRHSWGSRYELEKRIGEGGMGIVYAARHKILSHRVAIKILRAGRSTQRFLREAQILAKLKSPHVVSIVDYDVLDDGRPMLCMEWVGGDDLDVRLRRTEGKLAEAHILPWMHQTAIGMRDAATQGVVHRDLKPANVLFDEKSQVRVADFGVAHDVFMPSQTTESLLGTVSYMAPEQAADPRSVDTRADVYSFGATYYHVVTGRVPFVGDNLFEVLAQHQTQTPTSVRFLNENVSEATAEIIERCLAKAPSDRFQSFDDVLKALSGESASSLPGPRSIRASSQATWGRIQRFGLAESGSEDLLLLAIRSPRRHRPMTSVGRRLFESQTAMWQDISILENRGRNDEHTDDLERDSRIDELLALTLIDWQ